LDVIPYTQLWSYFHLHCLRISSELSDHAGYSSCIHSGGTGTNPLLCAPRVVAYPMLLSKALQSTSSRWRPVDSWMTNGKRLQRNDLWLISFQRSLFGGMSTDNCLYSSISQRHQCPAIPSFAMSDTHLSLQQDFLLHPLYNFPVLHPRKYPFYVLVLSIRKLEQHVPEKGLVKDMYMNVIIMPSK